jgi:pimeloyl-ACP methyl ester carboxylesterase
MKEDSLGPPNLIHSFTEAVRTGFEALSLTFSYRKLLEVTPESKPRPILVIPGFGAHDVTTHVLRSFLDKKGHTTYGWLGGLNTGLSVDSFARLGARFEEIYDKHDGQKIALIGHSLGGIFARELARAFPDRVEQVITKGSPFAAGNHPNAVNSIVKIAFECASGRDNPFTTSREFIERAMLPPPVPTTSIYSKTDGIVNWQTCLNPRRAKAENVLVEGSHCGLVLNTSALVVVADRLAAIDKRQWKSFDARHYPEFFHKESKKLGLRVATL